MSSNSQFDVNICVTWWFVGLVSYNSFFFANKVLAAINSKQLLDFYNNAYSTIDLHRSACYF